MSLPPCFSVILVSKTVLVSLGISRSVISSSLLALLSIQWRSVSFAVYGLLCVWWVMIKIVMCLYRWCRLLEPVVDSWTWDVTNMQWNTSNLLEAGWQWRRHAQSWQTTETDSCTVPTCQQTRRRSRARETTRVWLFPHRLAVSFHSTGHRGRWFFRRRGSGDWASRLPRHSSSVPANRCSASVGVRHKINDVNCQLLFRQWRTARVWVGRESCLYEWDEERTCCQ